MTCLDLCRKKSLLALMWPGVGQRLGQRESRECCETHQRFVPLIPRRAPCWGAMAGVEATGLEEEHAVRVREGGARDG